CSNVMEQFNPALRNLVNLGKSYEKSVTAMTTAGKSYFNAVSKIGENAMVSPMSRELGEQPDGWVLVWFRTGSGSIQCCSLCSNICWSSCWTLKPINPIRIPTLPSLTICSEQFMV
uniref:IMD domain-containing protein n=1 Tax=Xiphophorus couchianus TaxID=32473 RepID=A0A3B5L8I6_9TELE